MTNASSQFLRSANSTTPSVSVQRPSDTDVLNAAANAVKDLPSLAVDLGTVPALLEPVVRKLSSEGFLTVTTDGVTLSEVGERALRYSKVANF